MPRTIRRITLSLRALRAVLVLGIPMLIVNFYRQQPSPVDTSPPPKPAMAAVSPTLERHELAWYAPLWERDLKQPPIPKVNPVPTQTPPSDGPVPQLLATLVSPDRCLAHLVGRSGLPQLKALDESVDQYRVKTIQPGKVQLQRGEQNVWIELPKSKDKP